MTLGAHDPFRDVLRWDAETSRHWVEALDRRAAGADQTALRADVVRAAAPGDVAVEVGCGTGALLADLARAVGPTGRVLGVEPQPEFARLAAARLSEAGLADRAAVQVGVGERLPVASGSADVCVAQTVLVHLPGPTLTATLAEMVRVVRPGGRVLSVDQDGDTWVLDHPDRELTRRIVRFNSDQRYADGWTGRRLDRLFRQAGLVDVAVSVLPHVDSEPDSYLHGMALRLVEAAAAAGVLDTAEADRWSAQLAGVGSFFSSINNYRCVGRRPQR